MSVINKMLKDLEERDQEQGEDFDPSTAVYQAKPKNKLPVLLGLMGIVIVSLVGVVAWLLINKTPSSQTHPSVVSEKPREASKQSAPTSKTAVASNQASVEEKPKILNSSPVATKTVSNQVKESNDVPSDSPPESSAISGEATVEEAESEVSEEQGLSDFVAEEMMESPELAVDDIKPQTADSRPEPPESERPPAEFRIEKSSGNLSREERIARLMDKAQESFDKGYISDAITQLEEVLASSDNHVEARNLLAVAWYGRGELQQAVNILNDGLNRYPNTETWRVTAAKIFFKENEPAGAFTYLDADIANTSIEYQSMKATLARQLKRFDKAEIAYAHLTKLEPNKASWWLGYAIALDSQGKNEMAINSYQQAVSKIGISQASINFAQQRITQLQEQ